MLVDRHDPLDPDVSNRMHWYRDVRRFRMQVRQHTSIPVGHALAPSPVVIANKTASSETSVPSSRGTAALRVRSGRGRSALSTDQVTSVAGDRFTVRSG